MFGKTKPKAPPVSPAQSVGTLAAEALMGTLTMDFSTGYALVGTFKKYNEGQDREVALRQFVDVLVKHDPMLAGRLVDALAEKVGR